MTTKGTMTYMLRTAVIGERVCLGIVLESVLVEWRQEASGMVAGPQTEGSHHTCRHKAERTH